LSIRPNKQICFFYKKSLQMNPTFNILKGILNQINWIKQKESVLKRVSERGNAQEKEEIFRFYNL
jgi:hypothetical protein